MTFVDNLPLQILDKNAYVRPQELKHMYTSAGNKLTNWNNIYICQPVLNVITHQLLLRVKD